MHELHVPTALMTYTEGQGSPKQKNTLCQAFNPNILSLNVFDYVMQHWQIFIKLHLIYNFTGLGCECVKYI